MRLREAISRATALAGRGPVALVGARPGRVVALQKDRFMAVLTADEGEVVPWGFCAGPVLARALRDLSGDVALEHDGSGIVLRGGGAVARVPCIEARMPAVPAIPALREVPDWPLVARVFHAAGVGMVGRPELAHVRFGPDATEATDSIRVARAAVGIGDGELVPADAFVRWPEGPVGCSFGKAYAWFRAADELRIVKLAEGWFPQLRPLVEADAELGFRTERRAFEQAVTRAFKASPMKSVRLRIVGADQALGEVARRTPHITISRIGLDVAIAFEARIEVEGVEDGLLWEASFDGRRFSEALKALPGETATIAFDRDATRPIRFVAERYVELLYPLAQLE